MKQLVSLMVLIACPSFALADILQFGVVYTSDFKAGSPLNAGNGFASNTYVIINLGTASFPIDDLDLAFTSSLLSTTTPVDPLVPVANSTPGTTILEPGEAYGAFDTDVSQSLTLSYLQSLFPTVTSLVIAPSIGLDANLNTFFENPVGSGVSFSDTQTVVDYMLTIDGATAQWQGSWEMGYPGVQVGFPVTTVGYTQSNAVSVPHNIYPIPEPDSIVLMGTGLALLGIVTTRRSLA